MFSINRTNIIFLFFCNIIVYCSGANAVNQNITANVPSEIFSQYSPSIFQIESREKNTNTKNSYGSGFLVSNDGIIVTNYHVISDVIFNPNRFSIYAISDEGKTIDAKLIEIDVINDLALLKINKENKFHIEPSCVQIPQGETVYSFGNPQDIGLSIVNGTLNGAVKNIIGERLHFSGAINSGMSGGPTVTKNGSLVGINVSSYGSDMSFLVPCSTLERLIKNYNTSLPKNNSNFLEKIEGQVLTEQENITKLLLEGESNKVSLGSYLVPSIYTINNKCWSGIEEDQKQNSRPYKSTDIQCDTNYNIYIKNNIKSLSLSTYHEHFDVKQLNVFQLSNILGRTLRQNYRYSLTTDFNEITNYHCEDSYLKSKKNNQFRMQFCLRRYRKLGRLYDFIVIGEQINNASKEGIINWLKGNSFSANNARQIAHKFISDLQKEEI